MHRKVDNDHIRLLCSVSAETVRQALRLVDLFHTDILKQLRSPLQDNWMIVDNKNSSQNTSVRRNCRNMMA